jgi:hypothetical protein
MIARFSLIVIVCFAIVSLNGCCSVMIVESGKDLSKLPTSDEVHQRFGQPCAVGVIDGYSYEDYLTRQKIAEPVRGAALGMGVAYTYGLGEFLALPSELTLLARRALFGQQLRFAYNQSGEVVRIFLDGEPLLLSLTMDRWALEERRTSEGN